MQRELFKGSLFCFRYTEKNSYMLLGLAQKMDNLLININSHCLSYIAR